MKITCSRVLIATSILASVFGSMASIPQASAVQLDWSGQFWFESHWLNNHQLDRGRPSYDADPTTYSAGGPYVPGVGEKNVVWHSAFLRLKPKVIVNDSIHIKSEWHLGSPIYGFLGRDFPGSAGEQFNVLSSQKSGATISAARFYASLITDFGTIDLGRAPIHWGLGAIWNSGDNLFDRYQSTGDMVRLTSKFGNLSVSPSINKVAMGGNAAGALDTSSAYPGIVNPRKGSDDITDYNIALRYDNSEEDFDFGLMFTRRIGNASQSTIYASPTASGSTKLNFNLFDFYAKKKFGHFTFGGEVPLFTGTLGGVDGSANDFQYKSVAVIFEGNYTSDSWDVDLRAGHVPGQSGSDVKLGGPNTTAGSIAATPTFVSEGTNYQPIYLHRNYGLGLIMFHYNLYGLGGNNPDTLTATQLRSPYDNPIVNANYLSLTPTYKLDKWSFNSTVVFAWADKSVEGQVPTGNTRAFYNHNRRQFFTVAPGSSGQSSFMGWEMDYGAKFKWDENLSIGWTMGLFFPGAYWSFANQPSTELTTGGMMFASQLQAGISF